MNKASGGDGIPVELFQILKDDAMKVPYSIETCIISYKKQIASPGSIQDAWGSCTGMTQRDGTGGRWEGGSGRGTCVHLWRIHVDVWQNQCNIALVLKLCHTLDYLGRFEKS